MEQWPFNGKSLWASLRPGHKFAVFAGIPIFHLMLKSYMALVEWFVPWQLLRLALGFFGLFALPWVYVNSIGIFIAVVFELLFRRR